MERSGLHYLLERVNRSHAPLRSVPAFSPDTAYVNTIARDNERNTRAIALSSVASRLTSAGMRSPWGAGEPHQH